MKKIYIAAMLVLSCLAAQAQKDKDYAVMVSATIQTSPASITLHWPKDSSVVKTFYIYKKLKTDATFKTLLATLPGTDTTYIDNSVTVGANYEYELVKIITGGTYYGFGYISSGIEVPATETRGRLILIYDKAMAANGLTPYMQRMILDMIEDGWIVTSHGVSTTDSVTTVHNLIQADYDNYNDVNAVLLLGHIPVPYSGGHTVDFQLDPIDGHVPQHDGAWPADIYYSDMNGIWTDGIVTDTTGEYPAQHNVPGDGKFDQNVIPTDVVLQLGRVDMYDMPDFLPLTETDLLKRYLDKDHRWRIGQVPMRMMGYTTDAFGASSEAFGASGYKNLAPFFGAKNVIDTGHWESNLSKGSYLWSYAAGPGSIDQAGSISTTADFAKDSLQTVFTMLFGSWFGDWNTTNNYLRAALASKGPILTDCWSGRPQWQFHHMAMGDNIGYSSLVNFNQYADGTTLKDYSSYFRSTYMTATTRMIHVALMGDPTLRMHVVQPPGALTLSNSGSNKLVVNIGWGSSTEPGLLGYYVYRSPGLGAAFTRISKTMVIGTSFTDSNALYNLNYYMVRAVKLELSASGSYYNLSQGSMDTIRTLYAAIAPGMGDIKTINVFPNPGQGLFHIAWPGSSSNNGTMQVYDVLGNEISASTLSGLQDIHTIDINLGAQAKGVYLVRISNGQDVYMQRIVKE